MDRNTPKLISALLDPTIYDHDISGLSLIETHISWVILTGQFAYKIKKPVDFGFVDFTTLEKRLFYCEQELRLNRRYAPELYLQIVGIGGSCDKPRLNVDSQIIEYAVKMREFPQACLLSQIADKGLLQVEQIDSMAMVIGEFHANATKSGPDSPFGAPDTIRKWSDENFEQIEKALPVARLPDYFRELKSAHRQAFENLQVTFLERQHQGFVRECHGDLHLGNIAYLHQQCLPFDCIEFNDELRWIDTCSEIAFVVMDFQARHFPALAWRFLNRYLAISGDYAGLALLGYYVIYRALVRAKVEALQANIDDKMAYTRCQHYLNLAQDWNTPGQPLVIIMHGLSGSGKSTVAEDLAARLGAIQIRSDVERQRLYSSPSHSDATVTDNQGRYSQSASTATYQHLAELAKRLLAQGFKVIIDAACLQTGQRDLFRNLAVDLDLVHFLISCEAPLDILKSRIERRLESGDDASEADTAVLLKQLENQQILDGSELEDGHTLILQQTLLSDEQIGTIQASTNQHRN